jgi:hypothetical protein
MATEASLKAKIIAEVIASFGANPSDATLLDKFAAAVAKAVNDWKGELSVSGTVTSGPGLGGAVTGTVS